MTMHRLQIEMQDSMCVVQCGIDLKLVLHEPLGDGFREMRELGKRIGKIYGDMNKT